MGARIRTGCSREVSGSVIGSETTVRVVLLELFLASNLIGLLIFSGTCKLVLTVCER